MCPQKEQKGTKLFCFSPGVMIATFAIEVAMALFVVWRHKLTSAARVIVASLLCLALFQLCEYFVCGGVGISAKHWSRLGYASITMLPPLGLHLLYALTNKKSKKLVWFAYVTAAGFIGYFLLWSTAFRGQECTGNYVIFQLGERASLLYGTYYYSWLMATIGLAMRWHGQSSDKNVRKTIVGLIVGYLVFIIPTAVMYNIRPESRRGIPSIMCGFAVIFAVILAFYILPKTKKKTTK